MKKLLFLLLLAQSASAATLTVDTVGAHGKVVVDFYYRGFAEEVILRNKKVDIEVDEDKLVRLEAFPNDDYGFSKWSIEDWPKTREIELYIFNDAEVRPVFHEESGCFIKSLY